MRDMTDDQKKENSDLICGRNAVREALLSGRPADALYVSRDDKRGAVLPLIAMCRQKGVPVKDVDPKKLEYMCPGANAQGVILEAAVHEYSTVDAIMSAAESSGEPPFIMILDGIEDPHNLGAIIRTAECCGAHGIIVPERRSASLSGVVGHTSAGALEYMPVARVTNLSVCIDDLKKRGLWIYAAEAGGTPYGGVDLSGPVAIVIGSEGRGVSRLVKDRCDGVISLPMRGKINSLNASVAAGIFMFEVLKQRNGQVQK